MKVNVCLLLTIVFAYCLINGCKGTRWRPWPPPVRGYPPIRRWPPIRTWHPRPTIYRGRKSVTFIDDNQDDDIKNLDFEDRHLHERYVDMNDDDEVTNDIHEHYVDDPQEDD
uniref:Myticalin 1 n=1 Tax=Mytilus coruscus TaxID=42192 RepID=A0A8F6T7H8_MYTCO|nr:myticalin 1 [Mytilus coruscus]